MNSSFRSRVADCKAGHNYECDSKEFEIRRMLNPKSAQRFERRVSIRLLALLRNAL
jgi:hypothetical protein